MKGEIIDSYWTYKFEYGVANTTNVLELEEIIDFLKHFWKLSMKVNIIGKNDCRNIY